MATGSEPVVVGRLMSVDALRGFDMFWIIGADALVYALNSLTESQPTSFLATQLEHADWEGFRFYDLIFPLFVFIVGVSLVFSLGKTIEQTGRAEALKRVFRRGILLYGIGIIYSGGFTNGWPDIRLTGVLNRIALTYFFAGLLFCFLKPRALAGVFTGILVAYWAIMSFIPVRDIQLDKASLATHYQHLGDSNTAALFRTPVNPSTAQDHPMWVAAETAFYGATNRVTGEFSKGKNVSDHFDFQYLPGKKWDNFFDPEGILSTIPAVATCLLGVFAGLLLRNSRVTPMHKVLWLIGTGAACCAAGWLWNLQFPVIKKIWTSSYVLVAGGYSAMLLGVFYWVVDIWGKRGWCQPFVWMGMNSITVYLASNLIGGFRKLGARFAGGDIRTFMNDHVAQGAGELLIAIVGLALAFWFVNFLYRRKVFLRL